MSADLPVLLAMAGLPGTGKSTLARALAADLGAPILDKDRLRAELFGPDRVEYSRAQDDLCMQELYGAATRLARSASQSGEPSTGGVIAILDGRTYTTHESMQALLAAARDADAALLVIECRCADELAEERLAQDQSAGRHPARNRTPVLHRALKAHAEPLEPVLAAAATQLPLVRHLVLDTDSTEAAAQRARISRVRAVLARFRGPA